MAGARLYHVKRQLGAGSYGRVYLCEQESDAGFMRMVALKVLRPDHSKGMKEAARRMRDEARVLGRLSHRSIVSALDLIRLEGSAVPAIPRSPGDEDALWAVVMEYVDGADLDRVVAACRHVGHPITTRAALEIGGQVADALDAAWNAPDGKGGTLYVVHRDIKPSNIVLTQSGDVRVLDFGVARMNMDSREGHTGALVGTRRYMAPERLTLSQDGPTSDVYALGATLYELLAQEPLGDPPVRQEEHEPFIEAALELLPVDAHKARPLLRDMLKYDANARPSAEQVVQRCEYLVGQERGPSLRSWARGMLPEIDTLIGEASTEVSFTFTVAGSTGSHTQDLPPLPAAERTGVGAGKVVAGVALAALLGVVAVAILVAVRNASSPTDTEPPAEPVAEVAPPAPEVFSLDSDPSGASVWQGEVLLGLTPLQVSGRSELIGEAVTVKLEGYAPAEAVVPESRDLSVALAALPAPVAPAPAPAIAAPPVRRPRPAARPAPRPDPVRAEPQPKPEPEPEPDEALLDPWE